LPSICTRLHFFSAIYPPLSWIPVRGTDLSIAFTGEYSSAPFFVFGMRFRPVMPKGTIHLRYSHLLPVLFSIQALPSDEFTPRPPYSSSFGQVFNRLPFCIPLLAYGACPLANTEALAPPPPRVPACPGAPFCR